MFASIVLLTRQYYVILINYQQVKKGDLYKKEDVPGPGSYNDPVQSQWNKRTYNVLFAEV